MQCSRFRPAGRLDEYLACIAKIQKAVEYFQDNNPDSPELNTVVCFSYFSQIFISVFDRVFFTRCGPLCYRKLALRKGRSCWRRSFAACWHATVSLCHPFWSWMRLEEMRTWRCRKTWRWSTCLKPFCKTSSASQPGWWSTDATKVHTQILKPS